MKKILLTLDDELYEMIEKDASAGISTVNDRILHILHVTYKTGEYSYEDAIMEMVEEVSSVDLNTPFTLIDLVCFEGVIKKKATASNISVQAVRRILGKKFNRAVAHGLITNIERAYEDDGKSKLLNIKRAAAYVRVDKE